MKKEVSFSNQLVNALSTISYFHEIDILTPILDWWKKKGLMPEEPLLSMMHDEYQMKKERYRQFFQLESPKSCPKIHHK